MGTKLKNYLDNIVFGVVIGILVPLFLLFIIYEKNLKDIYLNFITRKMLFKEIIPAIFNWCILPNILFFMIVLYFNLDKAAKGLIIITIIEVVLIFILKFGL